MAIKETDWQNPTSVVVFALGDAFEETAREIGQEILDGGVEVSVDPERRRFEDRTNYYRSMNVKLYVGVGAREAENREVRISRLKGHPTAYMPLTEAIERLHRIVNGERWTAARILENPDGELYLDPESRLRGDPRLREFMAEIAAKRPEDMAA